MATGKQPYRSNPTSFGNLPIIMKSHFPRVLRPAVLLGLGLVVTLLASSSGAAPAVTATQRDSLVLDNNGNTRADSGDVLLYTVVITNSGATSGTNVWFAETLDTNTTYVAGSIQTTPLALNDQYAAIGNIQISISAPGVLGNDVDPDGVGPALTVTSFQNPSANNATVNVSANGAFTYNPAPGFTGADTFTYTISDGEGNQDTGTVTVTVTGVIWFVNAAAAPGGDGRLTAPFNALTGSGSFAAVAADDPGDNIFLYSGNYTGGLTLLNDQKLIGQGAGATLASITGLTPPPGSLALPGTGGARPTVSAAANNVTLGAGNLVRGLNLNNTGGTALFGASVGNLTLAELSVSNTTGSGVNLTGGTLTANLTSVSTSGGANGIKLVNTTGSFAVTGTGGAGSGGSIQNTVGGDGGADGNGVYLDNASNVALTAMTLGGHQNFAIRGNAVSGLALTNCTINGVNGTSAGLNEGSVSFTGLTGAATLSGCNISGGLTDNVRVVNSSGALNRLSLISTTIGANSTVSGNDGVLVEAAGTATINVTVTNCNFTSARADLLQLNAVNTATMDWVVVNSTFANNHPAIVSGGGGTTFSGGGAGSTVNVTYRIANNTFRDALGIAVNVSKGSGAGNYSGSITDNQIGVLGVANSGSAQASGIQVTTIGTGTHTTRIENNAIRQYNENGIYVRTGEGSSTVNATIRNNTVSQPGGFALNGLQLNIGTVAGDSSQVCADIGNNTLGGSGPFGADDFNLRQRFATTIRLPGYAGANNNTAAVISFVQGNNTGVEDGTATVSGAGGGFVGGAACVLPLLAMPENVETITTPRNIALGADQETAITTVTPMNRTQSVTPLTETNLQSIVAAAKQRWVALGLNADQQAALDSITFRIAKLEDRNLGAAMTGQVTLDRHGAEHGWFIDVTPLDEVEFARPASATRWNTEPQQLPAGRYDLLTAVMHELGHAAGFADSYHLEARDSLMYGYLPLGERRLPTRETVTIAATDHGPEIRFIGAPISIGTLPPGKSITITFRAVIDPPPPGGLCQVANQGTVSGDNFVTVLTDDPDTGTPSDPTITPVNQPEIPTITPLPPVVLANSTTNQASGPGGATAYAWTISNGVITSATNLQTITYTAGAAGNVTLNLTILNAGGCGAGNSIQVAITAPPAEQPGCPFPTNFVASTTFTDGLSGTTIGLAFDGTNYWSVSGGGPSGNRLARYDAAGAVLNTYAPGLDFRSVFTTANGTVLARAFSDPVIYRQNAPGGFVNSGVTLTGGTLDDQSAVVLNGAGNEYLAMASGTVSRWSTNGTYLGSVTLQGYGSVSGENDLGPSRRIAAAGAYWLTYNGNQILSIWDANGNRRAQATLIGAGNGFDAGFSFSYCNGKAWVVDGPGGTWRGYEVTYTPLRVAVLGVPFNAAWGNDVRSNILSTDKIFEVDLIPVGTGNPLPTLSQLQGYQAVLAYSDANFSDAIGLGNVLADYVDQGGGVVLATFAFYDVGDVGIQGRLKTGGYLPFTTGNQNSGSGLTLVKDLPQHPLLFAVNSFNGGSSSYHNSPIAITAGATLVASWSNGQPLVGAKQAGAGRVVGLNFFPPSSNARSDFWAAATDGGRLMANALLWTGQHPPAVVTPPAARVAVVGETVTFNVAVTGSAPRTYQWRKNGTNLPGQTGTNLTFVAQFSSAGQYSVAVSNLCGGVISANATLTVIGSTNVVVTASDRGWYNSSGFHDPGNFNHFVGYDGNDSYRNWFVFNIPPLAAPLVRAELRAYTYGVYAPTGSEIYQLRQVVTPTATLQAGGAGLISIYNDLGDGPIYAARAFVPGDASRTISIPLNQTLRNAVAAAAGNPFAMGGEIITLTAVPGIEESVFSGSSTSDPLELVLIVGTGDVSVAGYFTDNDPTKTGLAGPILTAGFTPHYIGNIATQDFSGLRLLLINEISNGSISPALAGRLPEIEAWVRAGGRLIVHDRSAGNIPANPFLLGTPGTGTVRLNTNNLDLVEPATTLVTAGPFGVLNNTLLDGGNDSAHGYLPTVALPPAARAILQTGPNQVASFAYPLGAGFIYYSAIPLDYYLPGGGGGGNVIAAPLTNIYTPNVISYVHELRAPLRFLPPALGAGDNLLLHLESADGVPIAPHRLPQIRIYSTTNVTQPIGSWTLLANPLVLTNGQVRVENVSATNAGRFFRAMEIP
jgi:uncharacterized repeat protein (TIGR01451 family)